MNRICRSALALLILACAAPGAHAQRLADLPPAGWSEVRAESATGAPVPVPGFDTAQETGSPPTTGQLVLGGSLGALVGFFGGAYLGYHAERNGGWSCNCDDPGLAGLLYGAAIGSTLAVPTAVHLFNERRGSFGQSFAASALVGALGLAGLLGGPGNDLGPFLIFGPPLAQVAASVVVEHATSR